MGNSLGGKKTAKIMKINGETMKFKTPIQAREVVKDYPGHVVLDSEAVKQYGIRAKPLDPFHNLEPKKLYFLVELPRFPLDHHQHRVPRRVRSGIINMSAKDRLESLLLSRRSVSDLSIMGRATRVEVDGPDGGGEGSGSGGGAAGGLMRLKMKLPRAEVERLMSQSRDNDEVADKIVDLCMGQAQAQAQAQAQDAATGSKSSVNGKGISSFLDQPLVHRDGVRARSGYKKRVGFKPIYEGERGLAVAS